MERFSGSLFASLRAAESFEAAAGRFAEALASRFHSIALARVFATVEYKRLPQLEREFASSLVSKLVLFPTTEVLTLFGTAGSEPAWCDRRRSQGHLAIPLLNRQSIDAAPMIAKLLNDLHFTVNTESPAPQRPATRAFANANALCHIADAATTVDVLGRPIIPASDFVRSYGIRTVIGIGGSYIVARMFVAIVLFTTETIPKETAMHLLQLSSTFKAATTAVVRRDAFFE